MTNKFKNRVRAHANKHGMSYQAAAQQLDKTDRDLAAEVEQLRVQLAGCSVAAQGHATGDNDAKPGMYGHSVAFDDVKQLRERFEAMTGLVDALWGILDDIDTTSDMVKTDDQAFRKRVEELQRRRWDTGVVTDGYRIFTQGWPDRREKGWLDRYAPGSPHRDYQAIDSVGPEVFADTATGGRYRQPEEQEADHPST